MKTVAILVTAALLLGAGPLAAQDDVPEVVRERLEEGDRHRDAGRLDAAIASYREARRLGPAVLEVYASLGALYTTQGDLEEALEVFAAGLEIAPDDRQLLYNAAVVALRLGRPDEALGSVERALRKHRGDGELHSLHGAVLGRLGRTREALAALETAVKRKPGDPQILFRLGNLHHQLGQKEPAIEAFRKAIKKDRTLLRAYYNLGAVLLETGRYDEALDAYRVALEPLDAAFAAGESVDPIHARAYQNLGAIHFHQEEWQPALDAYGKALALDPELSGALYNQGFIHFRLGQEDDAAEAYRRALELDPELPLAYLHLGQIHQRRGEPEAAVRRLSEGLPRLDGASRLAALKSLAECQAALGRTAESEKAYRALLEAEPDDLPARLALGRLLKGAGRPGEARAELERVRRSAPEHLGAALELAALARLEGRTDDQKTLYEEVLSRAGERPGMWPVQLNLGLLYLRQGAVAEARPHLEALARLPTPSGNRPANVHPDNGHPGTSERQLIATIHGLLLALDGDLAAASQRLRSVLAEDADFTAAADILAVLDVLEEGPAKASATLEQSYSRLAGGAFESLARANLGQTLWLTGRHGAARTHLESAAEAFPQWMSVKAALGDVALAERRYRNAVDLLSDAAALCRDTAPSPLAGAAAPDGVFQATIGDSIDGTGPLCGRLERSLALARVGAALEELSPALHRGRLGQVLDLADLALAGSLEPVPRAVALFVRGTSRLAQGSDGAARSDLTESLAGELPANLRALAHNNLGIASTRLGRLEDALEAFVAARGDGSPFAEATLNLAILLDDHADQPREALAYYREYLAGGGSRQQLVEGWVERLERIYR